MRIFILICVVILFYGCVNRDPTGSAHFITGTIKYIEKNDVGYVSAQWKYPDPNYPKPFPIILLNDDFNAYYITDLSKGDIFSLYYDGYSTLFMIIDYRMLNSEQAVISYGNKYSNLDCSIFPRCQKLYLELKQDNFVDLDKDGIDDINIRFEVYSLYNKITLYFEKLE